MANLGKQKHSISKIVNNILCGDKFMEYNY